MPCDSVGCLRLRGRRSLRRRCGVAIAVFAGPCLNVVNCDDYDQKSDDTLGLIVGLELQLSKHIAFGASAEIYSDDTAVNGSVSVRF